MKMCHGLGGFQTVIFTKNSELRSATNCFTPGKKDELQSTGCDFSEKQKWTFKALDPDQYGLLIHKASGKCLTFDAKTKPKKSSSKSVLKFLSNVVTDMGKELTSPLLKKCNENDQNQLWAMNLAADWK